MWMVSLRFCLTGSETIVRTAGCGLRTYVRRISGQGPNGGEESLDRLSNSERADIPERGVWTCGVEVGGAPAQ